MPRVPLTQKGLGYVKTFLTAVDKSRRDGLPSHHENHITGTHIMPKRSGQRHGSWSDLKKPQLYGFQCHLWRELVQTFANLPEGNDGARRFSAEERTYRLQAMQYLVSNMAEHYATLPDQPKLWECWAFHERLVLPPSQRGRSEVTRKFTIVYPDPDNEVDVPGTGGRTLNKDLGAWQLYIAWQYGTYWVAGFLAERRVNVGGPQSANVGLWPIANRTHPESEEKGDEEEDEGKEGADKEEGEAIGAPSGPVMAPPSVALPVVTPSVPTLPTA